MTRCLSCIAAGSALGLLAAAALFTAAMWFGTDNLEF